MLGMKNKLILAAIASVTLAACSNDDVVSVNNQTDAIKFRTAVTNSRASEVKTANLTEFWVTSRNENGVSILNNTKFVKDYTETTTNTFIKDGDEVNWPGGDIRFYALNMEKALDFSLNYEGAGATRPGITNVQPEDSISKQFDMIYATNTGDRNVFASVPLTFNHAYSQIEIQAKNNNTAYTVKVKGYRIGYVYKKGTFIFPAPVQENKDNTATFTAPVGNWSDLKLLNDVGAKGNNYSSAEIADANVPTLGEDPRIIRTDESEGTAMIIPQKMNAWQPTSAEKGEVWSPDKSGAYLALLVQIDRADGTHIFPGDWTTDSSKRVSYEGLPAYYGYAAVPIDANWEPGKKYTYILDFTDGCGKVDPEKPDVVDPDNPDPKPDPDPDPFGPGDDIVGHAIKFVVKVTDWVVLDSQAAPMGQTISSAPGTTTDEQTTPTDNSSADNQNANS
jgi:hypothetical protein